MAPLDNSSIGPCRKFPEHGTVPIGSMYGIYTYIWLIFMVNVVKYTIHGSYGVDGWDVFSPRFKKRKKSKDDDMLTVTMYQLMMRL